MNKTSFEKKTSQAVTKTKRPEHRPLKPKKTNKT